LTADIKDTSKEGRLGSY